MRVKWGKSSRTLRAAGPLPIIISKAKSSMAEYKISSTVLDKRWISSIKSTSLSPKLVRMAAKSPCRSIAGPLVTRIFTFSSLAIIFANVVLPRPGGPKSSTWSRASWRAAAALIKMERLSLTWLWPIYSFKSRGRRLYCQPSVSCSAPAIILSSNSIKLSLPLRKELQRLP